MRQGAALAALASAMLAACYAPDLEEGLPCTPDARCPDGLVCETGGVCLSEPPAAPGVVDLGFGEPVPVPELNGPTEDRDMTLTEDLTELYFNRLVDDVAKLHRSTRASPADAWSPPAIVPELDDGGARYDSELSPDGLALYFSEADIYLTTRASRADPWSPAVIVDALNSSATESPGPPTEDGLRLIFQSSRFGTDDLFEVTRDSPADPFGPPVLLLELYSPANDHGPQLSPDGLQVVFQSDRAGGDGCGDLYVARRASLDAPFDPPRRVAGVSTNACEYDPWIARDGALLMFSRDVGGNVEIFEARVP